MKPDNRKKLSLRPETLRTLTSDEAARVAGGGITSIGDISKSCLCGSGFCSIGAPCDIKTNNTGGNTK